MICVSVNVFAPVSVYIYICIYIFICWVRPNSCNSQKKDFFIFWANVVLSVFLRAQNRAFRCFPSCKKSCSRSCFLVLSLVHKIVLFGALLVPKTVLYIVLFGALLRAKIVLFGALLRALLSFVQTSCSRSCFLVLSFVHKIVVFVVVPRAKNCAFSPNCLLEGFSILS